MRDSHSHCCRDSPQARNPLLHSMSSIHGWYAHCVLEQYVTIFIILKLPVYKIAQLVKMNEQPTLCRSVRLNGLRKRGLRPILVARCVFTLTATIFVDFVNKRSYNVTYCMPTIKTWSGHSSYSSASTHNISMYVSLRSRSSCPEVSG